MASQKRLDGAALTAEHMHSGLNEQELNRLYRRFMLATSDRPVMTREEFLDLDEIVHNPLGERLVDVYLPQRDGVLDFKAFLKFVSDMSPVASREDKVKREGRGRCCCCYCGLDCLLAASLSP
jgi:Ca2+-binding EF-hand superfamily protein